uniref:uncharacterized protein LOC122590243 n=1 Tax=Erigeron canadensis TaxID=72917 RepID=UPI001CB91206|nr:uncharacterized protein LOC122590243 [Erigeron canadensis]
MEIMSSNFDHDNQDPTVLCHNAFIFRPYSSSSSYHKLHKQRLNLSILKLDGSSFGIQVSMNASVADLKLALEDFFTLLPNNNTCIVSWSHVWGHFCLCYQGQKLLDDKANIRRLGIKDGDQIKFVRHVSTNHRPRQQIKNQSDEWRRCSVSNVHEDGELVDASNSEFVKDQGTNIYQCQCEEDDSVFMPGSKLTNFLKGWFSYRKLRNGNV